MNQSFVPEPLATILETYCDANAIEMIDLLKQRVIREELPSEEIILFKKQLYDAIKNQTVTPEQYKKLTGDNEYPTQEALQAWLRELWDRIYPDEKI